MYVMEVTNFEKGSLRFPMNKWLAKTLNEVFSFFLRSAHFLMNSSHQVLI